MKGNGVQPMACVSQLSHGYDRIPETTNIEGEKIYFHSQFQRFEPKVTCAICFRPLAAPYIMAAGAHGRGRLLASWQLRSKESTVGQAPSVPSRTCPGTYFLPPSSTSQRFPHLPGVPQAGGQAFDTGPTAASLFPVRDKDEAGSCLTSCLPSLPALSGIGRQ